jgi:alpha-pyrone synthase
MSHITAIGTAVPTHKISQQKIAAFMIRAMQPNDEETRKLKAIFRASGIANRYSVLADYGRDSNFTFYSNASDFNPFPSTEKRNAEYQKHATQLSVRAVEKCLEKRKGIQRTAITHLITVSCTGLYAPGLDIDLVKALGLSTAINRTAINFMGCYAALNAIKMAHAFCEAEPVSKVLIVCTELCSLHFQKECTEDNMLANALFADGSAAMLMESKPANGFSISPTVFHNGLSFTETEHMAWSIGDFGFEMKLSAYVPTIIQRGIKALTSEMVARIGKTAQAINYFAIHPGGKKILQVVEQELGLNAEQNLPAYTVLNNYGNMSSPTVVFVIEEILKNLEPRDSLSTLLSFSFGPGLTLEGILFTIHHH